MLKNLLAALLACLYIGLAAWLVRREGQAYRDSINRPRQTRSASGSRGSEADKQAEARPSLADEPVADSEVRPAEPREAIAAHHSPSTAPKLPAADHGRPKHGGRGRAKASDALPEPPRVAMHKPASIKAPDVRHNELDQFWDQPEVKKKWDLAKLGDQEEMRLGEQLHDMIVQFNPPARNGELQERVYKAARPIVASRSESDPLQLHHPRCRGNQRLLSSGRPRLSLPRHAALHRRGRGRASVRPGTLDRPRRSSGHDPLSAGPRCSKHRHGYASESLFPHLAAGLPRPAGVRGRSVGLSSTDRPGPYAVRIAQVPAQAQELCRRTRTERRSINYKLRPGSSPVQNHLWANTAAWRRWMSWRRSSTRLRRSRNERDRTRQTDQHGRQGHAIRRRPWRSVAAGNTGSARSRSMAGSAWSASSKTSPSNAHATARSWRPLRPRGHPIHRAPVAGEEAHQENENRQESPRHGPSRGERDDKQAQCQPHCRRQTQQGQNGKPGCLQHRQVGDDDPGEQSTGEQKQPPESAVGEPAPRHRRRSARRSCSCSITFPERQRRARTRSPPVPARTEPRPWSLFRPGPRSRKRPQPPGQAVPPAARTGLESRQSAWSGRV